MSAKVPVVVETARSLQAAQRAFPVSAVQLRDAFWAPRLQVNREVTIPGQLRLCEETGRIDNFRRAAGKKFGEFQGIYFNDSDVYKWAEAAAWSLAAHPDPKLDADLDAVIAEIAAAQQPDGYLNSYFMFEREKERFANLKDLHEIYCAGHLFQAAVAHHRATGKTTLLEIATRLAEHLYDLFGPGKRLGACGHPEAEMALVELYRETGETRYLELAQRMIEARGQNPPLLGGSPYHQDHLPFAKQTEATGHAVRQLYLCCGAADVYAETGDKGYWRALEALWHNFTRKRMYVTGGAGSRYEGEAFGEDYELPNDRAYTETCAAIASVMWNWRMLLLTGEARFADAVEWTLYNAVLPGLALDGTRYFYQNPLADRGKHRRQEWFGCACCPPNIARMLASLSGYLYSASEQGIFVQLYAASAATLPLPNGETFRLTQETDYPWNGEITLRIEAAPATPCGLFLRIPGWVDPMTVGAGLSVNGEEVILGGPNEERWTIAAMSGQYVALQRAWQAGDLVKLTLPMPTQRLFCHPRVQANLNRVALRRGPLLYCIEQADHPDADVWDIALHPFVELTPEHRPDLLGGLTVLRGRAIAIDAPPDGPLYEAEVPNQRFVRYRPVSLTAIPYYAWANREAGPMQVWLPAA